MGKLAMERIRALPHPKFLTLGKSIVTGPSFELNKVEIDNNYICCFSLPYIERETNEVILNN